MLAMTAYVYAIGFLGLRQPEIFAQSDPTLLDDKSPDSGAGPQRYSKSGLSAADAGDMKTRILELMDRERPYTNPDLTLLDLSRSLGTSNHKLSQLLNAELGENFYDFVNRYRVTEIKARLEDDGNSHLTILSIGLDAGFNSKSSFNSVFKKKVGMTPSQYRASVRS